MLKNKKSYKLNARYKTQSQRQLKVAQSIQNCLVECLRKEAKLEQGLHGFPISITEVNISPDLKVANCFFVPFNTKLSINELQELLDKSKYVIRRFVTEEINLKFSPEIRFYFDEESENAFIVEELLKK